MLQLRRPLIPLLARRDSQRRRMVDPRGFARRHWALIMLVVLALTAGLVWWWSPWQAQSPCGRGLTATGSPYVCVGLDLDSAGFRHDDPLADLEQQVAEQNSAISGEFATIVLLDSMSVDRNSSSADFKNLRNRIKGAITAVWRANNEAVAGGTLPKIRLLLASYGDSATHWSEAVDAIMRARTGERIVAVAGIGQSLDRSRQAVAALSEANIATVGSVVTADNMNEDMSGKHIQNFVRVAPLNTDQAIAALSYITKHSYGKIMLVRDVNQRDSYAQTLAAAFSSAYEAQHGGKVEYTESYRSPEGQLAGATREEHMTDQFAAMHSDICAIQPDLIYFAGRGTDLRSFLIALSQSGACSLGPLNVMTGDDASSLVGAPIPTSPDLHVRVLHTTLAHGDQWNSSPPDSDNRKNFEKFAAAFATKGYTRIDLADGQAMMSHDAVLTAATAARDNPLAISDPATVSAYFLRYRCAKFIPGASGPIALDPNGNPIEKVMPILQIQPDGSVTQEDLAWPKGRPLDPATTCQ